MRSGLAAFLTLLALLTACGGGGDDSGTDGSSTSDASEATEATADVTDSVPAEPEPTPDEAGLQAAAEEVGARFAAQDFTGYYDLWTADAQALTTRDEYAAAAEACDLGGIGTEVEDVRIEPDGSGIVRVGVLGQSATTHYLFEGGEWRLDPDRERLTDVLAGTC